MKVSIDKKTLERMHGFCYRGERHDNLINRLLDSFEEREIIDLKDETWERLCSKFNMDDANQLLNMLMDKCHYLKKKGEK